MIAYSGRAAASARRALLLCSLLGVLLSACGQASTTATTSDDTPPLPTAPIVLEAPTPLTDFQMPGTTGQDLRLSDFQGSYAVLFFGYTHCPDVCQQVMASIAGALTRLTEEQRARVDVVFVTTDPARDDRRTLRHYLDRFDPSFVGLTGDLATITRVAAGLKVFVERGERLPSGGYEVAHGTPVIGITADDRAPIVWTEGTPATDLAEDVAGLLAG